jgi:hypothetical protein
MARNTEDRLLTLRKNFVEVEQDTDEAFRKCRELVKLLIEKLGAARDEDGRVRVDIRYRFSPPGPSSASDGLDGVRDFLRSRQMLRPTRMKKKPAIRATTVLRTVSVPVGDSNERAANEKRRITPTAVSAVATDTPTSKNTRLRHPDRISPSSLALLSIA